MTYVATARNENERDYAGKTDTRWTEPADGPGRKKTAIITQVTEKHLKQINLVHQITDMQRQLTQKDHDYEEQMEETKRRYEDLIAAEQQRHERRLAAMQERLQEAQQQQQQQDTSSPTHYEQEIEKLREQLSHEKTARAREAHQYQAQLKQKQSEPDAVELLRRASAEQIAQREAQMQRMREMFMRESQEQAMHQEARIQNLQSEHADALKEARDQLDTEREVWQIEMQAALDQVRRQIQDEKEEEIQRINREWQGKMLDIQTSMSKDASAVQQHWSGKLKELEEHEKAELDRLKGEIEVVKDRLGNEIHKRHRLQAAHSALQQREHSLTLESRLLNQQIQHLTHSQQRMARELEEVSIRGILGRGARITHAPSVRDSCVATIGRRIRLPASSFHCLDPPVPMRTCSWRNSYSSPCETWSPGK